MLESIASSRKTFPLLVQERWIPEKNWAWFSYLGIGIGVGICIGIQYHFQQPQCLRHLPIQVCQALDEPHVWGCFWRPNLKTKEMTSKSVFLLQIQDMLRRNIRINACPSYRIAFSITAMIILNMQQQMSSKKKWSDFFFCGVERRLPI